jgi:hypothetical protein
MFVKKNQKLAIAALKGLFTVLKDFPTVFKKRMPVQKMRKVSDDVIMKSMHAFNPWSLRMFLLLQAKGKRLAINK